MTKTWMGIALGTALALSAGSAAAETQGPADIAKDKEGLTYDFRDADGLTGLGHDANAASIRVHAGIVRRTLIRPRASFVQEMLKSVEHI
jgi:hypothetical protein